MQRPHELGCVREGAYADLLVVDGNPLEDLSLLYGDTRRVDAIYRGGVSVPTSAGAQ